VGQGDGRWPPVVQLAPPTSPPDESPAEELPAVDDEASGAVEPGDDAAVVAGSAAVVPAVEVESRGRDPATGDVGRWVTEIDTTGTQAGTDSPYTEPGYAWVNADGTRAVNVTSAFPGDGTTRVSVLRIV
jgi:hypothetical protein